MKYRSTCSSVDNYICTIMYIYSRCTHIIIYFFLLFTVSDISIGTMSVLNREVYIKIQSLEVDDWLPEYRDLVEKMVTPVKDNSLMGIALANVVDNDINGIVYADGLPESLEKLVIFEEAKRDYIRALVNANKSIFRY